MRIVNRFTTFLSGAAFCAAYAGTAQAQTVNLTANLVNSCVVSISSAGTLAVSSDGRTISTDNSGGQNGTITLVAVGRTPTVRFTAPALESPTGAPSGSVTQIRYTSTQGANQAWTSTASSAAGFGLIDTFTVHGQVTNANGFAGGRYNIATTVTCEQQ